MFVYGFLNDMIIELFLFRGVCLIVFISLILFIFCLFTQLYLL